MRKYYSDLFKELNSELNMNRGKDDLITKYGVKILLPLCFGLLFLTTILFLNLFIETIFFIHFGDNLSKLSLFNWIFLFAFIFYIITISLIEYTRKKFWFFLTLFSMIMVFFYGVNIIHILNSSNFLSSLGILLTLILISIPIAMNNLKELFNS